MARIRFATVAAGIAAVQLVLLSGALGMASRAALPSWTVVILTICAITTAAAVGMLIGIRRPGHPIGLLLALAALLFALTIAADSYGRFVVVAGHDGWPGGTWAVLWANASWPAMFAGVTAIAFVFPDGALPSRRWRPAAWAAAMSMVGVVVLSLFSHEPFDPPFEDVANPMPELPAAFEFLQLVFLAGMAASLVAAGLATRARFRRSEGLQRQQILWLACAAWLIPVTLIVCFADLVIPGELDALVLVLLLATVLMVPAAIGVAILRWRLYELDRLVRRAVLYGVLTGCVVAIYVGVVLTLGLLVRDQDSFIVTLIGTAAVAVAIHPLRTLLQRTVDRLFYGDRKDPYAGLSRLADRLESSIAPQTALRTIVDTVAGSLRVPFVAIDLIGADGRERAAAHGEPVGRETFAVPLTFQGEPVGQLVVESRASDEPLNAADRRLLGDLARHAGPVVHAIRLTVELQRSRERLVVAQEQERRRIRRDLHDGLGPVLATAVFQVDAARDVVASHPEAAERQLGRLRATLQGAVSDIRGLVYALQPPALDEVGLVPALTDEIARLNAHGSGPRISLCAPRTLPVLPAVVEVAAYRIAMEAVTNAVRHSGARACSVTLGVDKDLQLDVVDDGDGRPAAPFRPGIGIASMTERANELGGAVRVQRRPGGGTTVHMELPLDVDA